MASTKNSRPQTQVNYLMLCPSLRLLGHMKSILIVVNNVICFEYLLNVLSVIKKRLVFIIESILTRCFKAISRIPPSLLKLFLKLHAVPVY